MGLLKKKFKNNFTQVPNTIIRDNRLSYKAKGLYMHLVSKPDNWVYRVKEFEGASKDGRDSVQSGIKELEKYEYLIRVFERNKFGKFKCYDYYIYDEPLNGFSVGRETRLTENPSEGKTPSSNTKPTNTDSSNTDCIYICETREEFKKYVRENLINQDLLIAQDKDTEQSYIISVSPDGKIYDKKGTNFSAKRSLGMWDTLFEYHKRHQLEFQKFTYKPHTQLKKF